MERHRWKKSFGLGLIGIGRTWGHVPGEIPSESDALRFLEFAFEAGVRYFDTAPSYGSSEARLGLFLRSLTPTERAQATVATKFGEHWDEQRGEPFADHSYGALARSLEQSLERLGPIDVLQLHKSSVEVLHSEDLARAWESALKSGIKATGPSVADPDSARAACDARRYKMLQLPLNQTDRRFEPMLGEIEAAGLWVVANRPFAMGRAVAERPGAEARVAAFRFVMDLPFQGVILNGTKSTEHLLENLEAFGAAQTT